MIIAFLLDGIISRYFMFFPLLTLISLIYENKNKYLLVLIIGILYDIVYTDTLFLNTIIFYLCLFFIEFYFRKMKNNFLNKLLLGFILIIIYRISTYLFLSISNYLTFDFLILIKSILFSLISLLYIFIRYIYEKMI